jgi:hypothetical protein
MNFSKLKFWQSDPHKTLVKGLERVRGDADAIALLPYDDGTFYMKPANFDKELIGGQGGYETEDGDKIVLDGGGEPVKSLLGIDVILAVDPTEHAAAVEPIKALIAHRNNLGEWLKVDKKGNIIEAGDGVELADDTADIDVGPEGTMVEEVATNEQIAFDAAMAKLEKQGDVSKVYDIAPPAAPAMTDGGEVRMDEATHIAVDQSKAADLMPTTTSTTELNTALDKARMEEYEEGKLMKYFVYGAVFMSVILGILGVVTMVLLNIM